MRSPRLQIVAFAGLLGTVIFGAVTHADKPHHVQWLDQFESEWNETAWTPKSRGNAGYMRPLEDQGWKTRMHVRQALIVEGRTAVPALLERLKTKSGPQRILAAQALGYLAPFVPREALLRAAKDDDNPSVRLYAVDALGMHGGLPIQVDGVLQSSPSKNSFRGKSISFQSAADVTRLRKWPYRRWSDNRTVATPSTSVDQYIPNVQTSATADLLLSLMAGEAN